MGTFLRRAAVLLGLVLLASQVSAGPGNARFVQGASGTVESIAVLPDGRILIGGTFAEVGDVVARGVARLRPDGTPDPTFTTGSGFDGFVHAVAALPDGASLIGGDFTHYNGVAVPALVRLHADGTLDRGFAPTTTPVTVTSIAVAADGTILAGGIDDRPTSTRPHLVRLAPDGTRDASFPGMNDDITALATQTDGTLLVGRKHTTAPMTSLSTDGEFPVVDPMVHGSTVHAIAVQADDRVIAVGNLAAAQDVVRLRASGFADPTFHGSSVYGGGSPHSVTLHGDRILVGGSFDAIDGASAPGLVRLLENGQRDGSFQTIGVSPGGSVAALAVQGDGRILVGGNFSTFGGEPGHNLVRLNPDGTRDASFMPAPTVQPTTPAPGPTAIPTATPALISVTARTTRVRVSWRPVPGAAVYRVEIRGRNGTRKVRRSVSTTDRRAKVSLRLTRGSKAQVCVAAYGPQGFSVPTCARPAVRAATASR